MNYPAIINKNPIFSKTSEEKLTELFRRITWQIKRYKKGEMIAQAGEECRFLMIVAEGAVKGEMTDAAGKLVKIEDIHSPNTIALSFIFGKQNRFPVNVTAISDCSIMLIPKPDLLLLLQSDKHILENMMHAISTKAQFLSKKIRLLSFSTIKEKVSKLLLELNKTQNSATVVLPSSQTDLAELFGVTRPSLSRTFSEMADEGIIKVDRRNITILNRERLLMLCEET